jgi:HEAT repeat protein
LAFLQQNAVTSITIWEGPGKAETCIWKLLHLAHFVTNREAPSSGINERADKMTITRKLSGPAVILFLGLLILNPVPGKVFASEHDTLVAQLRKDDWHAYFSNDREKLNTSFDSLLELANNRGLDWQIRIRCIILLSETRDPRKADVLVGMFRNPFFNSECPAIKTSVVTALGTIGNDEWVVDALIDGMNDRELQVREAAVQALGRLQNEKAVPFLIKKLSDRSFSIRISAVKSLGQIKDQKAIPFLKDIADHDPDDLIRNEATLALNKMKIMKAFRTSP